MRRSVLLLPLWLASCGGGASLPSDDAMEQAFTAGRLLSSQKDPVAAQTQFETAYQRAILRDEAAAIGDAGYDLAAALLAQDRATEALATVARTRAALALRGHAQMAELSLVAAASLHRLGRDREAMAAARVAANDADADIAARATYVLGLAADASGDEATLAAACDALHRLPPRRSLARQADADELAARLALRRDDPGAAELAARSASSERRLLLDYRGMRVALGLAAIAADRAGDPLRAVAYRRQVAESLAAAR